MNTTPLRDVWSGHAVELGITWTLRKRNHLAQCVLFSHQFGWELRNKAVIKNVAKGPSSRIS
jgi:hypothetical protein